MLAARYDSILGNAELQRFPAKPNRGGFDGVDDSVGAAGHSFSNGRWCRAQFSNPGEPHRARSESRIRWCALLVCEALGVSESAGHWLALGDDRWRGPILMTCESAWSKRSKRARRGGRRPTALRSPRARRSNGCSVGARAEASQQSRPGGAFRRSRSTRPALLALIAEQPDWTLEEVVEAMHKRRIAGSRTAVWRFLKRHEISFKKKPARDGTRARGRGSSAPALDQATALSGHDRAGLPR